MVPTQRPVCCSFRAWRKQPVRRSQVGGEYERSRMADDQGVVEETGGEETPEVTQDQPKQTPSEEKVVEAQQPDQPEGEATTEYKEVKSERGKKRVQDLAREAKSLREQLEASREQPKADSQEQLPPWMRQEGIPELGDEVTREQYEQHLNAKAQHIAKLEVEQLRQEQSVERNLDRDITDLEKKYPELAGEISDKGLEKAIRVANKNFQTALKADKSIRYKDFIEPLMQARSGGEQSGREKASANLAKQADSSAVKSKTPSQTRVSSEDQLANMLATGEISAEEAMKKFPDLLPLVD